MKRYDIFWTHLDPIEGSEMGKMRPAVLVSLDVLNQRVDTVVVCPITSQLHPQWRTRIPCRCAGQPAEIAVDHIRSISKSRLSRRINSLGPREVAALRRLITEMYGEG
jgi:mRNA interferase MazF